MSAGRRSRWSRRFLVCSAGYLLLWRAGVALGVPSRTEVVLGLFGFAFHAVFGMGYVLIPAYFERVSTAERAPAAHLALAVSGTVTLAVASLSSVPAPVESIGAVAWFLGVLLFVGSLLWTVRDNIVGAETGTGDARESHRWVDRVANRFVPLSLGYLVFGSYELAAASSPLPGVTDGSLPRISHLLAAGSAALLVFALGVRLAPRFLGVPAPRRIVAVVLPAGAIGPALLAFGLGGGTVFGLESGTAFVVGALTEATAVLGFAAVVVELVVLSDRRRVGFFGVLCGVLSGSAGAALGLIFALGSITAAARYAHLQLNLFGFLGLTVAGFAFQFFPPSAGRFRGANDRTAFAVLLALAAGLVATVGGTLAALPSLRALGTGLALLGGAGYAYVLCRLLIEVGRRQRRR